MALIEEVRVMSFSRLLFVAFLMITSLMAQTTPPSGSSNCFLVRYC
jgi:hypothetical protein